MIKVDSYDQIEYCKIILETSRMYGMKDTIVEYIVEIRNNAQNLIDAIIENEFRDCKQLKNKCSLCLFLITKNYFKSEAFKKDIKEAIELQKEIFIILLEKVEFTNNLINKFEIFDLVNYKDQMIENLQKSIRKKLNMVSIDPVLPSEFYVCSSQYFIEEFL
jgi:Zn-dependent M32 family carboxypeptidase